MSNFLDNWKTSCCWDNRLPDPEPDAPGAVVPRAAVACKALPPPQEAADILASLGISMRYVTTTEEAQALVAALAAEDGHIGLDTETAKLSLYNTHPQAGLNPHLSQIRLVQLHAGGSEVFVIDL